MRVVSIEAAELGALEEGSQAICITLESPENARCVIYGLRLSDGDTVECSLGPVPAAAAVAAKRVVRKWAEGAIPIPFYAAHSTAEIDV